MDNERLEFLGDAILSTVVSARLFEHFPSYDEGQLSKLKSSIVSRRELAHWARNFSLGEYLYLSKGEEQSGGRSRSSILSNAMEAVIGAVYCDRGFKEAQKFVLRLVDLDEVEANDPKSELQEFLQKRYQVLPEYRVAKEKGPDHEKIFEVVVSLRNRALGRGRGASKKMAEQTAAAEALTKLHSEGA